MTPTTPVDQAVLLSAFAWSLLDFFWQGAILALALGVALKISRNSSPRLRYAICCIVLAGMVACPIFTCARFEVSQPAIRGFGAVLSTGSAALLEVEFRQNQSHLASLVSRTDCHIIAILLLWFVGALFSCARVLASVVMAQRLKTRSLDPAPDAVQSVANRLAARLKLSVAPHLLSSNRVTAPVVVGWRKPTVLLPASSLGGLSLQQTETILAHELAHIQRGDYLVNLLQAAVEALLFYHPAIWWVSGQIRCEREYCCDDLALSMSGSALAYAKALTVLEERRSSAQIKFSLGMSGGDLSMRIKRLFEHKEIDPRTRRTGIVLASLGALTIAALALLSISAADRISAQTAESVTQGQHQTATTRQSRPDMSCTYADEYPPNRPHPGICGEGFVQGTSVYFCQQTDGKIQPDGTRLNQIQVQIACGWKVQRLLDWEQHHGYNQSDKKSRGDEPQSPAPSNR